MPGIALCKNEECSKAENCFRYKNDTQGTEYMEFQNICNEETNFERFWKKDIEIVEIKDEK